MSYSEELVHRQSASLDISSTRVSTTLITTISLGPLATTGSQVQPTLLLVSTAPQTDHSSHAQIIGGVVGIIVAVSILVIFFCCCRPYFRGSTGKDCINGSIGPPGPLEELVLRVHEDHQDRCDREGKPGSTVHEVYLDKMASRENMVEMGKMASMAHKGHQE